MGILARNPKSSLILAVAAVLALILTACAPYFWIGFQGLLTDSNGSPITGTHNFVFKLWNNSTASDASNLQYTWTANNVQVTNGLFETPIGPGSFTPGASGGPDPKIYAQPLWLEITIDGQTLSPRQPFQGVPYAMSLVGGAVVASFHEGDGAGGVDETNVNYASLTVASLGTGSALGIWGLQNAGDLIRACTGPLVLTPDRTCNDLQFKVDTNGNVRADGSFASPAADFAEMIDTRPGGSTYVPGDVIAISKWADRTVELADQPYSKAVIGVYSTKPAFLGGASVNGDVQIGQIPVAIVGIVPVKVSAENGPINRGDLLTTSSTPGHAMLADEYVPGTILGKAMGRLGYGTGVIEVFLILR